MSDHIDLNAAAPQTLAQPKRGRGRPRKNPPPPQEPPATATATATPPPPPPAAPDPAALPAVPGAGAGAAGSFAPKDLVWGKKLAHPSWPGEVLSVASGGTQLLVSFFGEKALAWCDAAQLRPYEAYFSVGELYDGEADDFDAAVDASLHEFSRRVQAALTAPADAPASLRRPFAPLDFLASLQDLAADRMGFSNRVQAAITKAHLRAFDAFRGLPDPPTYTLELGIVSADASAATTPVGRGMMKAAATEVNGDYSSTPPSRRGRKRKEEVQEVDSDEDWDPRKKGGSDSDTDIDMGRRRASRGRGSGSGAPRGGGSGRPRGRPRKTDAPTPRPPKPPVKDEEVEEEIEYPPAAEMLLQLTLVAADPFNFKGYDSVHVISSFFSKHKDSAVPSATDDKELLETLVGKKGRKNSVATVVTKPKPEIDEEPLEAVDGQRGRRKSAGGIYSARKAEDSYWCDIIISDFDDEDASSDYEGSKRKRASQNRNGNKKAKQEVAPQDELPSAPQTP
ncbi:uncharacterized protein [Lolium perenne]|uniref:uncharacterized protein n=1 Tax=Lolium perenne TaxID=4522 RepID=UPI0021EB18AE|nr:PWWP domain-containing protein 3-like [Lolium perenne]